MKIIAIIQARLNSLRYPNKVLEKINNKSVIEILLKRLKKSKKSIKLLLLQQINQLMTNLRMKY